MAYGSYLAIFLLGLLGGTHCVGMCGGIVSALTVQLPKSRPGLPLQLAYNAGRIASYTIAGAIMGGIGSMGLLLSDLLPIQMAMYVLANVLLVAMGLYLLGLTQVAGFMERIGQRLWKHVQPHTSRFLPVRSVRQAFPLGMLWGWLPCGLIYSALSVALMSGSAARGALTTLAFGLGTLPNLLLAGMLLVRFRGFVQKQAVRVSSGLLVLGFGVFGLANAQTLGGRLWQGLLCHV